MKSVKISKVPNGVGNYIAQFYDEEKHRWIIEAWKDYWEAVGYYSIEFNLSKQTHLQKSLILEL